MQTDDEVVALALDHDATERALDPSDDDLGREPLPRRLSQRERVRRRHRDERAGVFAADGTNPSDPGDHDRAHACNRATVHHGDDSGVIEKEARIDRQCAAARDRTECDHEHIEKELAQFGKDYAGKPLAIVAIGSNDAVAYPADNPEGLKQQAETFGFNFPYLFDETQDVARAYDAVCTPDVFLFDKNWKLAYRGQFDASRPGNGVPVTGADLRAAVDAVLALS